MTDVRHVRSYLVRSSRDELNLKQSEVVLPTVRESAVACDNLLRAGDFTWKNFDGVCLVVLAVVCGERLLSRELSVFLSIRLHRAGAKELSFFGSYSPLFTRYAVRR